MKQVWVKAATCSCTAATTRGAALPTLTTAMPEPRSMSELPSTSTTTPPPARSTKTGSVPPTPADTAAVRRSISARERGPGISVTSRRSCASAVVPLSTSVMASPLFGQPMMAPSRVASCRVLGSGEGGHDLVVQQPQLLVHGGDPRQLAPGEGLDQRGVGDRGDEVVDPGGLDLLDLRRHLLRRAREGQLLRDLGCGERDPLGEVAGADRLDDRGEAVRVDAVALQLLGRHRRGVDPDHAPGGVLRRR